MSTITATPAITPLEPLAPVDGPFGPVITVPGTTEVSVVGGDAIVDFPCAVCLPVRQADGGGVRMELLAGRMRLTLPVITVERLVDFYWVDPATGNFWQTATLNCLFDGSEGALTLDYSKQDFISRSGDTGVKLCVPSQVSGLFRSYRQIPMGRMPDECWNHHRYYALNPLDNIESMTTVVANHLREIVAAGAVSLLADARPSASPRWHVLQASDEPVVFLGGCGKGYVSPRNEVHEAVPVVRLDDPWVGKQDVEMEHLGENISRFLSGPTRGEALEQAKDALRWVGSDPDNRLFVEKLESAIERLEED